MQLLTPAAVFLGLAATANGQTTVGCDASCPPIGYESDTSHVCPGSTVDSVTASRQHEICHPTSNPFPDDKLSFGAFKQKGYVTVVANYYTGCEAGRRESGVFAGVAQRIHDETGGRVNFVTSLKGGGNCVEWARELQCCITSSLYFLSI
jgi:hypothetical protein